MKIGLISDTHNYLDPAIPKLFEGVSHILHGGDIGLRSILKELERIAPVTAVAGNTDAPSFGYRLTETIELSGVRFLLHHIVNPHSLTEAMRQRITSYSPKVVIFGHTHKVFNETIDGVRFLNPGYAGKQRFALSRSVALLSIERQNIEVQFAEL